LTDIKPAQPIIAREERPKKYLLKHLLVAVMKRSAGSWQKN
jgi:hypothetical protein